MSDDSEDACKIESIQYFLVPNLDFPANKLAPAQVKQSEVGGWSGVDLLFASIHEHEDVLDLVWFLVPQEARFQILTILFLR